MRVYLVKTQPIVNTKSMQLNGSTVKQPQVNTFQATEEKLILLVHRRFARTLILQIDQHVAKEKL